MQTAKCAVVHLQMQIGTVSTLRRYPREPAKVLSMLMLRPLAVLMKMNYYHHGLYNFPPTGKYRGRTGVLDVYVCYVGYTGTYSFGSFSKSYRDEKPLFCSCTDCHKNFRKPFLCVLGGMLTYIQKENMITSPSIVLTTGGIC